MPPAPQRYFWDSCVFCAYLYDEKAVYDVDSIREYLEDARTGTCKIFTSSIVLAEVTSSRIKTPRIGSMHGLVRDMRGATVMIDASVNVMELAGRLRDIRYCKGKSPGRTLSVGDALMLASCIHLEDFFNVPIDAFHTFDNAKKREVPLLSLHQWCDGLTGPKKRLADRAIRLNRVKPSHPSPRLPMP